MSSGIQQTNFALQPAGQTSIAVTGTFAQALPTPGTGQVLVTGSTGSIAPASGTTTVLRTVTALKTFYLAQLLFTMVNTGGNVQVQLKSDSTVILDLVLPVTAANTNQLVNLVFPVPIAFAAGVVVGFANQNTLGAIDINFIGWEQ